MQLIFVFVLHLILNACVQRFDVMDEKFLGEENSSLFFKNFLVHLLGDFF